MRKRLKTIGKKKLLALIDEAQSSNLMFNWVYYNQMIGKQVLRELRKIVYRKMK